MLRKILTAGAVAIFGLLIFGGTASADPYAGPTAPTLTGTQTQAAAGEPFTMTGTGFDPGEDVSVDGAYQTGSGLRAVSSFEVRSSPLSFVVTADSNGSFVIPDVSYDKVGYIDWVATGLSSGKQAFWTVTIGNPTVARATPAAAAGGGSAGGGSGDDGLAYTGAGTGTGSTDGGLAYTGANIAGPIAIGAAALLAGLAMLFFGTRGVIRHKSNQASR